MARSILANSFSLSMIRDLVPPNIPDGSWSKDGEVGLAISIKEISADKIPADAVSVIGHADTAKVLSSVIGREIAFNRVSYTAEHGDRIYIAQYVGPRLPEGATELPEGATFRFYKIEGVNTNYPDDLFAEAL